jgi:hypothetical protein
MSNDENTTLSAQDQENIDNMGTNAIIIAKTAIKLTAIGAVAFVAYKLLKSSDSEPDSADNVDD